ncbi:MAG: hypothetical protein JXB19_08810 [Bacteroidales bacterium]|nr:hypothetical protein [Bacteroidales bacterium]
MKKKRLLAAAVTVFLLFSNSAWVNLMLVRPSEIMLPDYIKTIAIVDRTRQEESPRNKFEQVLTGEFFQQDEQAVLQVAEGFISACADVERYFAVRTEEKLSSDGSKNIFPSTMDWNDVTDICNTYQADAILAIEIFDSDFIVTHSPVKIETNNEFGLPILRLEYHAAGVAVINFGIRLYDVSGRIILDEYQTTHRLNFEAQGGTIQAALNQMLDKVQAINRVSYDAGFIYASRITPTYYRVTRYFYDRPKKKLGLGVRMSEVADWNGAIDAWMEVVHTGKRKHAGRAAFNIAVACEVLGDLELAREWASRAYVEFRDREAEDYHDVLSNRIREENMVEEQLLSKE